MPYVTKKKAQTITIRLLGSPQATIHYGEVCAYKGQSSQHVLVHSSFQPFEVVIQKAIELIFYISSGRNQNYAKLYKIS